MGLVDYSDDSSSSDEEQVPKVLGKGIRPGFDGQIKPFGRSVEIKTASIVPGGKRFEKEPDLAVLAALASSEPAPAKKDLKRKYQIDLAPEIKRPEPKKAPEIYTEPTYAEPDQVHAIGGGRHQLSSLIRNAVDNKSALENQFTKNKLSRQARSKKYGF